jgi:hypothetical protein
MSCSKGSSFQSLKGFQSFQSFDTRFPLLTMSVNSNRSW